MLISSSVRIYVISVSFETQFNLHPYQVQIGVHEKNWLKRFGEGHRIRHFQVAMINSRLAMPQKEAYTLYHCNMEMTNSMTFTESLRPLFSCTAC